MEISMEMILNTDLEHKARALIKLKLSDVPRELVDCSVYEHSCRVAQLAAKFTSEEDLIIAAYLHDILEDSDYTLDKLIRDFGGSIACKVMCLTNKEAEIDKLGRCKYIIDKITHMPQDILTVKLCDRLDNIYTFQKLYSSEKYIVNPSYGNIVIAWYCCETDIIIRELKDNNLSVNNKYIIGIIEKELKGMRY